MEKGSPINHKVIIASDKGRRKPNKSDKPRILKYRASKKFSQHILFDSLQLHFQIKLLTAYMFKRLANV